MSFTDFLKFRRTKSNQIAKPQQNAVVMYYNNDMNRFEYKDSNGVVNHLVQQQGQIKISLYLAS